MSGEKYSSMQRRDFLKIGIAALSAPYIAACNDSKKIKFPVYYSKGNSQTGHLLRTKEFPNISLTKEVKTLIVGGGIAGMSAARWLNKNNYHDYLLIELDEKVGGNSRAGENEISKYPYGAHYLPIPDPDFVELIEFLHEHKIITDISQKQNPVYNEYFICHEPQERTYLKGIWQEGLPPKSGLPEDAQKELDRFLNFTHSLKEQTGNDGKKVFTIPLEYCSRDENYLELDKISIYDYLKKNDYRSDFIYWYLNYCCKDDFGSNLKNTSAWAAIHYFASRNGKAQNASSYELLTWPEGNNFLVNCLKSDIKDALTGNLAYKIEKVDSKLHCYVYDTKIKSSTKYICENIILATPQYVNKKIISIPNTINWDEFDYYPWLIANISIKNKANLNGLHDLSWDNVLYNSESLGYVNACHQEFNRDQQECVITFYYNFSEKSPKKERQFAYEQGDEHWKAIIINELKKAHPNIEEEIKGIELHLWGHGMISPKVGFQTSQSRNLLKAGFDSVFFANSDVSGISIFEEAFFQGIRTAKQILNTNA